LKTRLALQTAQPGLDTRHVLAINVPAISYGRTPDQITALYKESMRRITQLPSVDRVAFGIVVPWRDAGSFGPGFEFSADGHVRASGEEDPRAQLRTISPGFFAALGVPMIAGRDFNDADRLGGESVVIVSQSLAQRMFPNQDAVNRHIMWTDPVMKFIDISAAPRRIVGVAADVDDEHVVPGPTLTVYHPFEQQEIWGGRLFVHVSANPYALVTAITRVIRDMSVDQPVERAGALEGVSAAGAVVAQAGVAACAGCGFALARLAGSYFQDVHMPGAVPVTGSAAVLLAAAVVASVVPAARAARVDVMQALRSD